MQRPASVSSARPGAFLQAPLLRHLVSITVVALVFLYTGVAWGQPTLSDADLRVETVNSED